MINANCWTFQRRAINALLLVVSVLAKTTHAAGLTQSPSDRQCLDASAPNLENFLKRSEPIKIVFFASWCLSCKDHISESLSQQPKSPLFIAVFDEKLPASKAFYAVASGDRHQCYFDDKGLIAKGFGIKTLPAELLVKAGELRKILSGNF